jgi:hypothetical protein
VLAAINWDEWVAIGTLALAGTTVLAIAVAVFQEPIRRHFTRATVSMEIRLEPPDTHQIDGTDPRTGRFLAKLVYVRIRVEHVKGSPAENVEIVVAKVWRRISKRWEVVETFLPLSLAWSHVRTPTARVPSGLFRHCDLGRFQPENGQPMFVFDLIVQPNPVAGGVVPNALKPGNYMFELQLAGDNVRRITKRWLLNFHGPWSDHEATMLSRIKLTETNIEGDPTRAT